MHGLISHKISYTHIKLRLMISFCLSMIRMVRTNTMSATPTIRITPMLTPTAVPTTAPLTPPFPESVGADIVGSFMTGFSTISAGEKTIQEYAIVDYELKLATR